MRTLRTTSLLLAALAVSGPGGLAAQQAIEASPDSALAAWLVAEGLAPDSVELVDVELAPGLEVLILRIATSARGFQYWTVSRAVPEPGRVRRLGALTDRSSNPSIEAIGDDEVYIRTLNAYRAPLLNRYRFENDGSIGERELPPPKPGPVALIGDSAYAGWNLGTGGQLALAVSLVDDGADARHFRVDEPIEQIRRRGDAVAFITAGREIVRHPDGGWSGYGLDVPATPPAGPRLLHPSLPQFRVVPGGLAELRLRDTLFIPLAFPDYEHFRSARPDHLPGVGPESVDIQVDIGPVTDDGTRVWFGLTFYDGEGYDGVGGVGWLDPTSREAALVYPPEISDFSVTAIAVDRGSLLLGLATYGEGAIRGAGLARYDSATQAYEQILESTYISGIAVQGERIFVASEQGLIEVGPNADVRRWQVFPPPRRGARPPVFFSRSLRGD